MKLTKVEEILLILTMKTCYIFLSIILLSSCHYRSFIGYALNKKGFKHFSKKEKFIGSNENPLRNYDVNYYDWTVKPKAIDKSISGTMKIEFNLTESQQEIMLDFHSSMQIDSVYLNTKNFRYKHRKDRILVDFGEVLAKGTQLIIVIDYHGKPKSILDEGPIQWRQDSLGRTWISTQTEGVGPQFIMPCNALLREEPDSCDITVVVPSKLVAVANGQLVSEKSLKGGYKAYKFHVSNPINIYNISFNIGNFVSIDIPYENGKNITCWPLDYHEKQATEFYSQLPSIFKELESLFGEYPWWNDGSQFVESTFSAMEHQSCIAMGSDYRNDWKDYNLTLIHELSHEWWGNKITGYDYCDVWIHEGLATYCEALVIERIYGKEEYSKLTRWAMQMTSNKIPIHKECGVLYNSWANAEDQDIYSKGALMMHSLRVEVDNDSLFFGALKQLQVENEPSNMTTEAFCLQLNALLGNDYSYLFDYYLYQAKQPLLAIFVEAQLNGNRKIYYKWDDPHMFLPKNGLKVSVDGKEQTIVPTNDYQFIELSQNQAFNYVFEKSIYYTPFKAKKKK